MRFTIREGFKKLKHYKKLSFATFLTCVISYLMLGIFILFTLSILHNFDSFQKSETNMVVFVNSQADTSDIESINRKINLLDGVRSIKYISSEEGLKNLEGNFEKKGFLNNFKEDNPIPHTYIINFEQNVNTDIAYEILSSIDIVESVEYEKEYINEIGNTFESFKIVLICIVFGLLASSMLFISIVISLSIYNHSKNIKIMIITGAPLKYIYRPFILQGTFISFLSAIVSSGIIIHLSSEYMVILKDIFPFITLLPSRTYNFIPIIIISLSLILGFTGSYISTKAEIKKVQSNI